LSLQKANVLIALDSDYTNSEFDDANRSVTAALALSIICFVFHFLGIVSGVSLFFDKVRLGVRARLCRVVSAARPRGSHVRRLLRGTAESTRLAVAAGQCPANNVSVLWRHPSRVVHSGRVALLHHLVRAVRYCEGAVRCAEALLATAAPTPSRVHVSGETHTTRIREQRCAGGVLQVHLGILLPDSRHLRSWCAPADVLVQGDRVLIVVQYSIVATRS
jgi:hypothetical protein